MPDGCPRRSEAGAYLLGALSPGERADYAAHLSHCPDCLREIGQLAGLPGLLARGPGPPPRAPHAPDRLASESGGDPVTAALATIRRRRARGRTLVVAALLLVAGLGVGTTAAIGGAFARPVTGVSAAAELPLAMRPVNGAPVTAALAITDRPWGTEIVMRCRYRGKDGYAAPVYTLVATSADGSGTELARWTALADRDVVLATATDLSRPGLAGLEVRNGAGAVVLRTDHV